VLTGLNDWLATRLANQVTNCFAGLGCSETDPHWNIPGHLGDGLALAPQDLRTQSPEGIYSGDLVPLDIRGGGTRTVWGCQLPDEPNSWVASACQAQ
jgi:hypothetical protein